jgi:uncharacterized protein YwgA
MINLNYKEILLLYFISRFKGEISGRKRIQKQFYLLNKKYGQSIPFQYKLHYYGPFSRDLHETLITLVSSGLIKEKIINLSDKSIYQYQLTNEGKFMAKFCPEKLPDSVKNKVNIMIDETKYETTDSIVKEVYEIAGIVN